MNWMDIPPHWRWRCHPSPEARERLLAFCERLLAAADAAQGRQSHPAGGTPEPVDDFDSEAAL